MFVIQQLVMGKVQYIQRVHDITIDKSRMFAENRFRDFLEIRSLKRSKLIKSVADDI